MEFCKIPNFGTVTMETLATIMIQKKFPLQTEEISANIPANIKIQRFSVSI